MVKKTLVVLFLVSLVFALASCGGTVAGTENGVYSRYNLHYVTVKDINKGSYANWTRHPAHAFAPYNTKLQVSSLSGKKFQFVTDSGKVIIWEFDSQKMGMSGTDYINLITSPAPVSYEGLSDIDREGIEAGKAMPGMSKQGVMIALGYPAKHMTSSMESNSWTYWGGRMDNYKVEFDENGKVK